MRKRVSAAVMMSAFIFAVATFGQDTRAKVQGIVSDSSSAIVAGAAVTLRNDDTGIQAQQQTSQTGQYLFDFVLPGHYTVTVEMSGFKQYVQRNILVQARGANQYTWCGKSIHKLREQDGAIKIAHKKVLLVNSDQEMPVLQFLI